MSGQMNIGGGRGGGCSVGGSRKLSDALKSKYIRYSDPPQPRNRTSSGQYLTSLEVYGNREVEDEPRPIPSFCPKIIKEKIRNALMLMSFREPHVLVQFWSPIDIGKRRLLTTLDQPFALGVVDEGLYFYMCKSKQRVLVVDEEDSDELAPAARVFCQKLPEWSLDVHGSSTTQCAHDYAACFNIRGYIYLPVFEPTSGSCVGILELITSSSHVDFAFEVREVSRALKEVNLNSPNVFEDTRLYVGDERKQNELDEIFLILRRICDTQKLPLAQTWALAGCSSVVANSGNLEKCCSSFTKRCIGKVCMSTAALPFVVHDLSMWKFHEACNERHVDKSEGVVGRSLSAHGVCFCGDVSNLSEDDYPLAPYARLSGITSSLAVYLKSLETDVEYVIELFLPPHSENEADLRSVVKRLLKTVRQQLIENTSRVQLGIMSSLKVEVIGGIPLHWNSESPSSTEKGKSPPDSEDERWLMENEPNDIDVPFPENQNEVAYVEHVEKDNIIIQPANSAVAVTSGSLDPRLEVGTEVFDVPFPENQNEVAYVEHVEMDNLIIQPSHSAVSVTSENFDPRLGVGTNVFDDNPGETRGKYDNNSDKPRRKRKRTERIISVEEISKHFGRTTEDAPVRLCVSRSTLKRIWRNYGMLKLPCKKSSGKNDSPLKQDQTVVAVHVSEEFHAPVFGASVKGLDTNDTNFDRATLNKHSIIGSTLVPHQPEQTNLPKNSAQPHASVREKHTKNIAANTVENLMIEATYREDALMFQFNLSDGLVKLLELVAAGFQLKPGSFVLKYVDEEDDMIMIACDDDIVTSLSAFKQSNIQTLIRLLIWVRPSEP